MIAVWMTLGGGPAFAGSPIPMLARERLYYASEFILEGIVESEHREIVLWPDESASTVDTRVYRVRVTKEHKGHIESGVVNVWVDIEESWGGDRVVGHEAFFVATRMVGGINFGATTEESPFFGLPPATDALVLQSPMSMFVRPLEAGALWQQFSLGTLCPRQGGTTGGPEGEWMEMCGRDDDMVAGSETIKQWFLEGGSHPEAPPPGSIEGVVK